jgi:AraC family transcriptional regulator
MTGRVTASAMGLDDQADVCSRRGPRESSGELLRARVIGPFTVSEEYYRAGTVLPKHAHSNAFITFIVEGCVRETYGSSIAVYRAGALRFLPAGEVHENRFESDVRCIHIQIDPQVLARFEKQSPVAHKACELNGAAATWIANRLYAEFARTDNASAVAIEGLILEIFAEAARSYGKIAPVRVPRWLRQATEIVEARFLEPLKLTEIADEVGVHYVHLSREFRRYNRCTVGDLIRRRRIQYASHLLAHSETPLAEIALMCGFSDQSHLSFMFKRYMGVSPLKFRNLAGLAPEEPSTEGRAG